MSIAVTKEQTALAGGAPTGAASEFFRHARYVLGENPLTLIALLGFSVLALAALLGPALAPYDPRASDTSAALEGPSLAHWFGTDQLGRDIFSRVLIATRLDLCIAVGAVALSFALGSAAGAWAGYRGGLTDRIVSRTADTIMRFRCSSWRWASWPRSATPS